MTKSEIRDHCFNHMKKAEHNMRKAMGKVTDCSDEDLSLLVSEAIDAHGGWVLWQKIYHDAERSAEQESTEADVCPENVQLPNMYLLKDTEGKDGE
jgi:hypothetical protein